MDSFSAPGTARTGEPAREYSESYIEHAVDAAFDGWNPETIEQDIAAAQAREPDPLEVAF